MSDEDKDCDKDSLNLLDLSALLNGRSKEFREEGTGCGNNPTNPPDPPTLSSNKAVVCNGDSNADQDVNESYSISEQNKFPYNVSFITVSDFIFLT